MNAGDVPGQRRPAIRPLRPLTVHGNGHYNEYHPAHSNLLRSTEKRPSQVAAAYGSPQTRSETQGAHHPRHKSCSTRNGGPLAIFGGIAPIGTRILAYPSPEHSPDVTKTHATPVTNDERPDSLDHSA